MINKVKKFGTFLAELVARKLGTWMFIIYFSVGILIWIILNMCFIPFDPYPFIALNFVLACLASLQAPILMMASEIKEAQQRRLQLEDIKKSQELNRRVEEIQESLEIVRKEVQQIKQATVISKPKK